MTILCSKVASWCTHLGHCRICEELVRSIEDVKAGAKTNVEDKGGSLYAPSNHSPTHRSRASTMGQSAEFSKDEHVLETK